MRVLIIADNVATYYMQKKLIPSNVDLIINAVLPSYPSYLKERCRRVEADSNGVILYLINSQQPKYQI